MRRRLVLLASFAGALVACASILGDFEIDPSTSNLDASLTDGSSSSSGNIENEGGTTTDSGSEGGTEEAQPIGLQVATSTSATCATVQYPSKKVVTYCWGAQGAKYPAATVGANNGDPNVNGFFRPRLPTTEVRYLTFSLLTGAGTGEWFVGRGTDGQTTATYAWGTNDNGECAAGATTPTMPNVLKLNTTLLQFDTIYAAPNHGCMVQNQSFLCWGSNSNCELRSGDKATCNTLQAPPLTDSISRVVEDEGTHESGKGVQILRMAGGQDHSCTQLRSQETGPSAQDEIRCWGTNAFGQIDAANATTFVNTPTPVGVKVRRAGAELAAGENHSCAITDANKLACWGRNDSGQSNPANATPKIKPTEVSNVPGVLSTLRAAGDLSCVVAKAVGPSRAWCWGNGPKARAAGEETAPVGKVAGIQNVTQLAIGRAHACAVGQKEGAAENEPARVWCWGSNDFKRVDPNGPAGQIPQPIEIEFPPEPQ